MMPPIMQRRFRRLSESPKGRSGQSIIEYLVVTATIIGVWMVLMNPLDVDNPMGHALKDLMTSIVDQVPVR